VREGSLALLSSKLARRFVVRVASPQHGLPIGLIAPRDKALAEIKIVSVFMVLASGLHYDLCMPCLLEIHISWYCASRHLTPRRLINGCLRAWSIFPPAQWMASRNSPVVSR
jgi:hypothetical protein